MTLPATALSVDLSGSFAKNDLRLYGRILGEFREMPGLILTLAQAARLFNLERTECQQVLDSLVQSRVLRTDGRMYGLADTARLCA